MPRRKQVKLNSDMTVCELAELLGVEVPVIIKELFGRGVMRTVSMIVELGLARGVAISLGHEIIGEDDEDTGGTLEDLPSGGPPPKAPSGGHRNHRPPPRRRPG